MNSRMSASHPSSRSLSPGWSESHPWGLASSPFLDLLVSGYSPSDQHDALVVAMTSERSGAALNSADDDVGFSTVGCSFTGIGLLGAVLPLVGFGFTGGGSTVWLVALCSGSHQRRRFRGRRVHDSQ